MNKKIAFAFLSLFGFVMPVLAIAASPATVNLGTAGNFVILAKTGISTTGTTAIVGDMGVSPAAASYVTGFAVTHPSASAFSTSALVKGKVYASDYTNPTPFNLTTAVLDMQTAFTDAMGRASDVTELGAGNIGGLTLAPGVYKWGTGLLIPASVTLSGSANDIWIFQIAQNLNISSSAQIILNGGAQASNIFWVVAGQTTVGTTAVFNGNILDQTAIIMNTGATLNGRALAQTAVTLDSNAVTEPAHSVPATPAIPAIPAVPTNSPAIPAIPAISSSNSSSNSNNQVACTMEAMVCPDGSYVSRHGPNCAFDSCPVVKTPQISAEQRAAMQLQLNQLLATLHTLQAQQIAEQNSTTLNHGQQVRLIAMNLGQGSRNDDVKTLQEFLIAENTGVDAEALASVSATGYFGALTRAALAEFQLSVGISPAVGNFGSITRAYIETH